MIFLTGHGQSARGFSISPAVRAFQLGDKLRGQILGNEGAPAWPNAPDMTATTTTDIIIQHFLSPA